MQTWKYKYLVCSFQTQWQNGIPKRWKHWNIGTLLFAISELEARRTEDKTTCYIRCQNTWRPTTSKNMKPQSMPIRKRNLHNANETKRQRNTTPNKHNAKPTHTLPKEHDAKQHNTKKHNATRNTAPQWNNGRRQKPNAKSQTSKTKCQHNPTAQ